MVQQQKILLYVFPFIFAVSGINFPIGVLIYWLTTNLWSMGQQFYVIRNNPQPGTPGVRRREEREAAKAAQERRRRPRGGRARDRSRRPSRASSRRSSPRSQRKDGAAGPTPQRPPAGTPTADPTAGTRDGRPVTAGQRPVEPTTRDTPRPTRDRDGRSHDGRRAPEPTRRPTETTRWTHRDGRRRRRGSDSPRGPRATSSEEGDIAADYLEGLLDIADLDGDIDMDVEGDRAMVSDRRRRPRPPRRAQRRGARRAAGADPAGRLPARPASAVRLMLDVAGSPRRAPRAS